MVMYTIFYIVFFSAIKHKEIRFLMPILPFAIIPVAESVANGIKRRPRLVAFFVKLYILANILVLFVLNEVLDKGWVVKRELANF